MRKLMQNIVFCTLSCFILLSNLSACSQHAQSGTQLFDFPEDATVSYMENRLSNMPRELEEELQQEVLQKLNAFRYEKTQAWDNPTYSSEFLQITSGQETYLLHIVGTDTLLLWEDGYYQSTTGGYFSPRWKEKNYGKTVTAPPEELAAYYPPIPTNWKPIFTWDPETVTGAAIRDENYPEVERKLRGDDLENLVSHLAAARYTEKTDASKAVSQFAVNLTFQDGVQSGWMKVHSIFVALPDGTTFSTRGRPYTVGLDDNWLFDLMYPDADT